MCFRTDGQLRTWHGRRAWRCWKIDAETGELRAPIASIRWQPDGNPWQAEIAVCDTAGRPSVDTSWLHNVYDSAAGLYAYRSRARAKLTAWHTMRCYGTVRCYGEGYVELGNGQQLTAESMVIERVYVHAGVSRALLRKMRRRYPFVEFRRQSSVA